MVATTLPQVLKPSETVYLRLEDTRIKGDLALFPIVPLLLQLLCLQFLLVAAELVRWGQALALLRHWWLWLLVAEDRSSTSGFEVRFWDLWECNR